MNDSILFRQARPTDVRRILEIIRQAQAQMRALGSLQWQDGYPALFDIEHDLAAGYGWAIEKPAAENQAERQPGSQGEVIAYGAVVFDGEPAYEDLVGKWLSDDAYVVVHRLAVADGEKGHGVAAEFMRRVEELARSRGIRSFRVDTNFDNHYMLHLLERLGFVYCGTVQYRSGERLAFEKKIDCENPE